MSITTVAEVYGVTRMTLMSWIRNFEAESTQGLGIKKGRGRKRLIAFEHEDATFKYEVQHDVNYC